MMKLFKLIDEIEFRLYPGTPGACISGGADSAIMLYFLLKYSTTEVHLFSLASQKKQLRNTHASIEVISKCAELTGNYNFVHHVTYEVSQSQDLLFKLPLQYINNNIISKIYTGITKNPPESVVKTFSELTSENEERDPNIIRNVDQGLWYAPWTNHDKRDIYTIYKEYNLLESLYPLTRSCEWTDGLAPDPGMDHCGKCWWCEERNWGFGQL